MQNQITQNTGKNIHALSTVHTHQTRSSNKHNYYIPLSKSNLGKTSFSFYGPTVWNPLPINIKTASKFQFKLLLKKHLLKRYSPTLPALNSSY